MNRKKIIGVIGDANLKGDQNKGQLAFDMGKLIIDNGYRLATGGLGGVMEFASEGARSSENYKDGLILGVLPSYDESTANDTIDIAIPTGMGLARNVILTSLCDAVIAIGGGSGTLSEIALAWQMKKLVVTLGKRGWSSKIGGESLDSRRDDKVYSAVSPHEAIQIVNENIDRYTKKYKGVKIARVSKEQAESEILKRYDIRNKLEFLGKGSEGYVFTDKVKIFKLIDTARFPRELDWTLQALSEDIAYNHTQYLIPFEVKYDNPLIFVTYDYEETRPYTGGHADELISLLKEFRSIGWVITDFQPKNIRVRKMEGNEIPVVVDVGHSFLPYSDALFRKMARRVYLTSILATNPAIKSLLTETNSSEDFEGLQSLGLNPEEHKEKFRAFFEKVEMIDKKDVLNPTIREIIISKPEIRTLFDFGSGHGDMSRMIKDMGIKVTAYDPDRNIFEKYRNTNYAGITFVRKEKMKEIAESAKTFDCVLCSLVLCHPLAETKQQRDEIINEIMGDLKALSNRYIILAVCNPLYSSVKNCSLQNRKLPEGFVYSDEAELIKLVKSSSRERKDIHRPISYYENLFMKNDMKILEIHQTTGKNLDKPNLFYSDFMVFLLEANGNEKGN
ncbi:MAG: TIGR00725 family protein [Thermoplasmata archaeon]|nr:TIGR00725 family protein [Thermoplasmata archaeon]